MAEATNVPENHVIVCGLGQLGWLVLDYLRAIGWPLVAVDNRCSPNDPRLAGVQIIHGDCRLKNVLQAAGIAKAKALLVLTSHDLTNLTTALNVRNLRPDIRIVGRFFNPNILARLSKAVPNVHALSKSALTAPLFALTALSGNTLGAFTLPHSRKEIVELRIGAQSELLGQKIGALINQYAVTPLALCHTEHVGAAPSAAPPRAECLTDLNPEATLREGDRLVVCGASSDLSRITALVHDEETVSLLWASFLRRQGRVLWRAVADIEMPVKVVMGLFLLVVLFSSIIFVFAFRRGWTEGIYQTISVMATAADMRAERADEEFRLFVVFLRITGIVVTASLTALFTNYLVRTKFGGALVASKIPDSGHIVVCGLGNIGIRVVEELRRQGTPVVIVEKTPQTRFLADAKRMKAAVIIGDACQKDVLLKARAASAKAVIAATNDDLVNVEVALLARDLNDKQRVVLRLDDALLASALQAAASIRHALAVPALAAPAIVAALFQDRILCLFTCFQRIMAVVEVDVEEEHDQSRVGRPIKQIALDSKCVPVDVISDGKPLASAELANHQLKAGDRLTVIIAMADLDRFLRPQPAGASPPATAA